MGMNTVTHYKDSAGKPQVVTALTPMPVTIGGASASSALTVSVLPPGVLTAQPVISITVGNISTAGPATPATVTLSNPAKGLRITALGASDTGKFLYAVFDAPNDATRDTWLTETNAAPRVALRVGAEPLELNFNGATVTSMGYKLNAAATGPVSIHVEAIV